MSTRSTPGWVQVAPGRRYFQLADGTPFVPIGHADYALSRITDEVVVAARDHAENVLRIWPDALETGQINEEQMDRVVSLAEKYGIYLVVSAINASRMSDLFAGTSEFIHGKTIWNSVVAEPEDLLTDPAAIALAKTRLAYLIDRWGRSPNIFAWEIMNQIDALYMANGVMLQTWVDTVAPWIHAYERGQLGQAHLCAVSSYDQLPVDDFFYSSPHLDFIAAHNYPASMYTPLNSIDVALHVHQAIRASLARAATPRPYLDTEAGPISHFFEPGLPTPPETVLNEWFHNLIWANIASGAAGHTLVFPVNYGYGRRLTPEQGRSQQALARFTAQVDWSSFASHTALGELRVGRSDVVAMACCDETRMVGWLLRDTRAPDTLGLVDQALAQGPTDAKNRDLRLFALDAWSQMLETTDLAPSSMYSRAAIARLSEQAERDPTLLPTAYAKIDQELEKFNWICTRDTRARTLWATKREVAAGTVPVSFCGFRDGRYQVRWFDDTTGDLVQVDTVRGSQFVVQTPRFARHIACVVAPTAA